MIVIVESHSQDDINRYLQIQILISAFALKVLLA